MTQVNSSGQLTSHPYMNSKIGTRPNVQFRRLITKQLPKWRKELPVFSDVGIPGMRILLDSRFGKEIKFVYVLIMICIYGVCLYQVADRIQTYFSQPLSVDVTSERREYLDFPIVSICAARPLKFNQDLYGLRQQFCPDCKNVSEILNIDVFDLLSLPHVTPEKIWEYATVNSSHVTNLFVKCNEDFTMQNCLLTMENIVVPTFIGTCLSLKLSGQLLYDGAYTGIRFDINSNKNNDFWQNFVLLHQDPNELPLTIMKNTGFACQPEFQTDISYLTKEVVSENTSSHPCWPSSDFISCLIHCTESHISSLIACKLPYLKFSRESACRTPAEAKKTHNAVITVYQRMYELCQYCRKPCRTTQYSMILNVVKPSPNTTRINVLVTNNFVDSIKEVAKYNSIMLLGDIGGTVGFFLGICILNVVEMVMSILAWLGCRPQQGHP